MRQRFKRGNGEFLAAAVMSIFITSIMILIIAVMQMNFSINNITKAVTSASRAAAVCATKANAETLTLEVAQASIENQNLSDIKTKVEYAAIMCHCMFSMFKIYNPFDNRAGFAGKRRTDRSAF